MNKRVKLGDRITKDESKYSKAVLAFTSTDNTDVKTNDNVSNDVNNVVNSDVNNEVNSNVNSGVNSDVNNIVIKQKIKKNELRRATYYLMPTTLKKIDVLSKKTNLGKSALVQKLLEEALNIVKIE